MTICAEITRQAAYLKETIRLAAPRKRPAYVWFSPSVEVATSGNAVKIVSNRGF
jgi:hypothetical protein